MLDHSIKYLIIAILNYFELNDALIMAFLIFLSVKYFLVFIQYLHVHKIFYH